VLCTLCAALPSSLLGGPIVLRVFLETYLRSEPGSAQEVTNTHPQSNSTLGKLSQCVVVVMNVCYNHSKGSFILLITNLFYALKCMQLLVDNLQVFLWLLGIFSSTYLLN
jgi:hypothetical protein